MKPESLSRLVELVDALGPRKIPKIAQMLNTPVETVRHRLRRQLLQRGLRVHSSIDFGRLGLARCWVLLDLSDTYLPLAAQMGNVLAEVGYLVHYSRITPDERFVAQVAPPKKRLREYEEFLNQLISAGVLRSFTLHETSWLRHASMKPEYYDFRAKVWDIDWDIIEKSRPVVEAPPVSSEAKFDDLDLQILTHLQIDSSMSFTKMAKVAKANVKTLLYHYHKHVAAREFSQGYAIRWIGDPTSIKRHTIVPAKIWFETLSEEELAVAQNVFAKFPFTWSDSFSHGSGFYMVEALLPLNHFVDSLQFLQRNLRSINHRLQLGLVDWSCTNTYAIPKHMYNEESGWAFEPSLAAEAFKTLVSAVRTK